MLRIRNIGNAHAVDWFRILADLTRHGVSDLAVSKLIDVPPRTIGGWKNEGAQPRHSDGKALIDLWAEVAGHDRALHPRLYPPNRGCQVPLIRRQGREST